MKWQRMVVQAVLIANGFVVPSSFAQGNEAISVQSGDERWRATESRDIDQSFRCLRHTANYKASFDRTGIISLDLSVNGQSVSRKNLSPVLADLKRSGGFVYAGFTCSEDYFGFTFYPVGKTDEPAFVYQGRTSAIN